MKFENSNEQNTEKTLKYKIIKVFSEKGNEICSSCCL